MLTTKTRPPLLDSLEPVEGDALLALIALAAADPRPDKIDVGVGVYRDLLGGTPILRSVKAAEQRLWNEQATKSYLGGAGDKKYVELLRPIVLGEMAGDERIVGLQTPGGCGALRLGFELIAKARPGARVLIGTPTWPNHPPMVKASRLESVNYRYYDRAAQAVDFDAMTAALDSAEAGDVVLFHGCCHNPTGADLNSGQWAEVTRIVAARGLVPFIDFAYQGLGEGLDADAAGTRGLVAACDEALVAHSCDKNFGLYRDRVGALFVKGASKSNAKTALDHLLQLAREIWSMPPDHGAAVVRLVLEDDALRGDWLAELTSMRERIAGLRQRLAALDPRLAFIGRQFGMFSMLPLSLDQVLELRRDHAVYLADSGRFNVVGLADDEIERFGQALLAVLGSEPQG